MCSCLFSCDTLNPFEKEGKYTEKVFEFEEIQSIRNKNNFKILIIEDDSDFLILKGGENKIKKCEVNYKNGVVTINHSYKNQLRNYGLIAAEVHVSNLTNITIDAPANIISENTLNGENISIDIASKSELVELDLKLNFASMKFHSRGSASGGYHFSGSCIKANYIMNGITNIFANNLESTEVSIAQNGIGDAHVWTKQSLNVTIYNSGDIYYKGTPDISVKYIQVNNQNATGKVIKQEK